MGGRADLFMMAVIGILLVIGIVSLLTRWFQKPVIDRSLNIPFNDYIPEHPAVDFLQSKGYEVMGGRVKIPLYFEVNHEDYFSRLFIDYVVSDEAGAVYLVKTAKKRLPLEWTGSSLRDRLLPYFLLYPDCAGVIYMDLNEREIRHIYFEWDEEEWNGYDS
ncbi:hypothetical protein [Paenibacillus macquariensis]|uniref:DUF2726 domain-containing protein n=1 Tax=Paenibacillus macquariensis TaxID=948756 RepID=A0ABY1JKI0_9BACL|nr:hypothetical protein [Paenibacillus macquariensis]MEC0089939.1 hypothetical protein [Paenibacillus macquariensis]OAB31171.1 hypothetical protein PMSM_20855 [Paenibacillus macquariensis subsp. macquariensis]SIQ34686.1 hypothetical protein SAMN05421578_101325 [Paenibacillus macquariensis]